MIISTNYGPFNWDKKLPEVDLHKAVDSQKKIITTACKNRAYIGHSLSTGEKWKKGLEIAGIVVGTMLILPIPVLAFTGSYKRLARLGTELNNNISINGKVNNLANEILKNEDKILNGELKKFADISDKDILSRIDHGKYDLLDGTNFIEICLIEGDKSKRIGKLKYEFHYDARKPENERFSKKLISSHFNNEMFISHSVKELNIYRTITAQDKNGKPLDYLNFTGGNPTESYSNPRED